jgi:hypothetical protein
MQDAKIYNNIRFFGGFAVEKTPLKRATRVRAPRGACRNQRFWQAAISARIPAAREMIEKQSFSIGL